MALLSRIVSRVRGRLRALPAPEPLQVADVPPAAAIRPEIFGTSWAAAQDTCAWRFPGCSADGADTRLLDSRICRAADMASEAFRYWAAQIREPWRYHRKLWEYAYICQALYERGMLRAGHRGLGFAVGQEPLPALFASLGCSILATDLQGEDPRADVWRDTAQWAGGLEALKRNDLCPEQLLRERVSFQPVDMNNIPAELTGFDFTWSSCSFEHCGNLQLGSQFLVNQMRCLRPGGIAVHTTELNLSSNDSTLSEGPTVIFRLRDIEQMVEQLRSAGHEVEPLNLQLGSHELDRYVDLPPYRQDGHLRLQLGSWVTTSIGLIIRHR